MPPEHELRMVHVDAIVPDPENPQTQDSTTFSDLVDSIAQDGMTEAVTVVDIGGGKWMLVAGEHRWRAAKMAGLEAVPAIVIAKGTWDDDERAIRMVRSNVLRGRLDPAKFTALYGQLAKRYSPDDLRRMLGFTSKKHEMERLVGSITAAMPEPMKKEMRQRGQQAESVDDLGSVVQSLFARHGATVAAHFVLFAYGGRTHLMVECEPETFAQIEAWAERVERTGGTVDAELARMVSEVTANERGEAVHSARNRSDR
jgi:predicted amidohydrolase YtcJ